VNQGASQPKLVSDWLVISARAADPGSDDARYNLAATYFQLHDYARAEGRGFNPAVKRYKENKMVIFSPSFGGSKDLPFRCAQGRSLFRR
jgi:hypothetical protein